MFNINAFSSDLRSTAKKESPLPRIVGGGEDAKSLLVFMWWVAATTSSFAAITARRCLQRLRTATLRGKPTAARIDIVLSALDGRIGSLKQNRSILGPRPCFTH
jgi:hypothetical protein